MVSNIYPPSSGYPRPSFSPKSPSSPGSIPSSFGGAGTGSGGVSTPSGDTAIGAGGSDMSSGSPSNMGTPRPPSVGGEGFTSFGGGGSIGSPVSGTESGSSSPINRPSTSPSSTQNSGGPPPSQNSEPPPKFPGSRATPGKPSGTSKGPGATPSSNGLGQNMGSNIGVPPPPSGSTSGTGVGNGNSSSTTPTPGSNTGTGGGLQQKQRTGAGTGSVYVPPKETQETSSKQEQENSGKKSAEEIQKSVPSPNGNSTNPPKIIKPPNKTGNTNTDDQINNATKNSKGSTEGSDGADSEQGRSRGDIENINNAANEAQKDAKNNPKTDCKDCGTPKGPGEIDEEVVDGVNDIADGDQDINTDSESGEIIVPGTDQLDDENSDGVTTPEETPDFIEPWESLESNEDLKNLSFTYGNNYSKKKKNPEDVYGGYFSEYADTVDSVADTALGAGSDFRQNPNESLADSLFRWQQDPNRDYDPSGKADWVVTGRGSMQSYLHTKGYNTYGAQNDFGNDSATGPAFGLKDSKTTSSNNVNLINAELAFGARNMGDNGDLQGMSASLAYAGPIGAGSSDFSDFAGIQPSYSASVAFSVSSKDLSPLNAPGKLIDAAVDLTTQLGSQVSSNFRNKGAIEAAGDLAKGSLKAAGKIGLGLLAGGWEF